MCKYNNPHIKVIKEGDTVFDKVETINIMIKEIEINLEELKALNEANNKRLNELEKASKKLTKLLRGIY